MVGENQTVKTNYLKSCKYMNMIKSADIIGLASVIAKSHVRVMYVLNPRVAYQGRWYSRI
jgi:hypothetical protein